LNTNTLAGRIIKQLRPSLHMKYHTGRTERLSRSVPCWHRGPVEVSAVPILDPGSRWGRWSAPRLGRFIPGKENLYPFYRMSAESFVPPEFDRRTVQPVTSHYSHCGITLSGLVNSNSGVGDNGNVI
jgi:hypothetical protein